MPDKCHLGFLQTQLNSFRINFAVRNIYNVYTRYYREHSSSLVMAANYATFIHNIDECQGVRTRSRPPLGNGDHVGFFYLSLRENGRLCKQKRHYMYIIHNWRGIQHSLKTKEKKEYIKLAQNIAL